MKDTVTGFYVSPEEYIGYIERLDHFYEGRIPEDVVKITKKFVTPEVDLRGFNEDFSKLVR